MAEKHNILLIKAIPWTILDGVYNLVYSIAMVVLVGRFLEPEELGLASIALAITQLLEATYFTGMQESVIRCSSGHTSQSDTAHTLNLCFAFLTSAICCGMAWPISYVYGKPELFAFILVATLALPLNALFSVPMGLLSRKIRTRTLTARLILAKTFSLVTFVICLYFGLGAWSIILSTLASSMGSLILIFIGTKRWPKIRIIRHEVRDVLRYGATISGANFLWMGSQRLFMLFFGFFHGVYALGLFQFAQRLVGELAMLLQVTVLRVGLSYFSGLNRNDEDMADAYLLGTRILNSLATPVYVGLIVVSPIAVPLIFGENWNPAIPMIWALAISWIFIFPRILIPTVLKAQGYLSYQFYFSCISAFFAGIAILVTAPFTPIITAIGWGISQAVNLPYQLLVLRKHLNVPVWTQIKQTIPAFLASVIMGLVVWFLYWTFWSVQTASNVMYLIAVGIVSYGLLLTLLDRGLISFFTTTIKKELQKCKEKSADIN